MKATSFLLLALCASASAASAFQSVHGVYPHLHTFNREGECGTGAVVPWAGSLWAISYAPHMPNRSTDLLYEIKPDLTRVIHKDVSIGGTPANRLIHKESNQLFIGPYAIDAKGNVRVMPPLNADGSTNLYGRLTASARHLTDPAHKIYTMTMEEGVYEIDVDTLKVTELFRDGNIQGYGKHDGTLLPGYHGKGGYSGQGRLVYANNGEYTKAAMRDPTTTSGVLAQWNGKPGKENWEIVLRNQFTDITSKGGIYGAANPEKDPLWAIGWDYRSVILMVLDGGEWHKYRLPKGSHSYDGAHGWNTEWPRIREIGEGDDFLMTMHGTFWHFPATMSAKNSAGIRPRSNYLKIVGDFCRWGDKVVLGCDDTAANEFLNKRKAKGGVGAPGQSNSSLWFLDPKELDSFGPVIGRGAVWQNENVKNGEVSDPYLLAGYDKRTLYVSSETPLVFDIEVDDKGDGNWRRVHWQGASSGSGHQVVIVPLELEKGEWVRLVAKNDARDVTAFFSYANEDKRAVVPSDKAPGGIFAGFVSDAAITGNLSKGIVRSGKGDENLPLEMVQDDQLYVMLTGEGGKLELKKTDDAKTLAAVKKDFAMDDARDLGDSYDSASAIITDNDGRRWRFPYASAVRRRAGRLCRECCTERDLLNIGGTFYELPAENAGGFSKARAVATHRSKVYDYCTWRGLFVISGVDPATAEGEHFVKSDDGKAALWVGVADDLWAIGKPTGIGGPWNATDVNSREPSDPYIMTGFDKKKLTVCADADAKIKVEIDLTGSGTWSTLMSIEVKAGTPVEKDLSGISAYWVRFTSDTACTATAQLVYE